MMALVLLAFSFCILQKLSLYWWWRLTASWTLHYWSQNVCVSGIDNGDGTRHKKWTDRLLGNVFSALCSPELPNVLKYGNRFKGEGGDADDKPWWERWHTCLHVQSANRTLMPVSSQSMQVHIWIAECVIRVYIPLSFIHVYVCCSFIHSVYL